MEGREEACRVQNTASLFACSGPPWNTELERGLVQVKSAVLGRAFWALAAMHAAGGPDRKGDTFPLRVLTIWERMIPASSNVTLAHSLIRCLP